MGVIFSRILDGITGGTDSTAQAYIADISAPENRAKNFGLIGAAFGLGFILGPALGGFLAEISLTLPVFFTALLALFNAILGYVTLPESLTNENQQFFALKDLNPFAQIGNLLINKRLKVLLCTNFIFTLAFTGFTSIFVLFLSRQFEWNPSQAGVIFIFVGVTSTLVQGFLLRSMLPIFGEVKLTLAGLFSIIISFITITLIEPNSNLIYPLMYLSMSFFSLGSSLFVPSIKGLISNQVSEKEQGKTIGATQSCKSLATIVGPVLAGFTFDYFGIISPFYTASFLLGVAMFLIIINLKHLKHSGQF